MPRRQQHAATLLGAALVRAVRAVVRGDGAAVLVVVVVVVEAEARETCVPRTRAPPPCL